MTTMTANLIDDATHELDGRQRGRTARLARLAAAGVATDRRSLQAWLDAALDAAHEAAGGLYHASTVRVSSGCDDGLPKERGIGCRITRVPIVAEHVQVGDDESAEETYYVVRFGSVTAGCLAPTFDRASTSCAEAESRARSELLRQGDCYLTRAAAVTAASQMLRERVAAIAARTGR